MSETPKVRKTDRCVEDITYVAVQVTAMTVRSTVGLRLLA
jgi:tetrahydromethanopterin S-methyltransferase subunit F